METARQQLNTAQITLLRLLERKITTEEVEDIHQMLANYFDSKLQAQVEKDIEEKAIKTVDFESIRAGEKVKDIVAKRAQK